MKKMSLNLMDNKSKASSILDLLRFFSALVVFLFHFYVPLPGYQAVMIFFVLSGYFISSTVLKSVNENRWNWAVYLLKRITRLWIVLIPCLFLTLIWAAIQLKIFGSNEKLLNLLGIKTFLGNLFFLQGILVKPYGLNGPLWSLSYEFWYYILFPCLILTIYSKKTIQKFLYAFLFLLISFFVGERIMVYFIVWLLGAIIPLIKPLRLKNKFMKQFFLITAVVVAALSTQYQSGDWNVSWSNFGPDLRLGMAFSILIYFIVSFYNNNSHIKFNLPKYLAGFSYTLYLAHYPVANFVMVLLVSPIWPFTETPLVIKMFIALGVILYCWLIGFITERHTDRVRTKISIILLNNKSYLDNKQKPFSNLQK